MNKEFTFTTHDGEIIRSTTFGQENLTEAPCLIFVHGFKGFKDWGFGPYLGEYFAEKGYFVITFNFSHNGIGNNKLEFTEPEKFARNTFSREVGELNEIISAYESGFFGNTRNNKIGIIGHSRGGAIALLTAAMNNSVSALVTWAGVSKLDRYSKRQKEVWREKGVFEVLNSRTKQVMRLNVSLLEDIEQNGDKLLNIEKGVKNLNKPYLIAHGSQDLAVPLKEAEQLYAWGNKEYTELFVIESTGHTFDIKHPFEESNEKFENLLNTTRLFFAKNL